MESNDERMRLTDQHLLELLFVAEYARGEGRSPAEAMRKAWTALDDFVEVMTEGAAVHSEGVGARMLQYDPHGRAVLRTVRTPVDVTPD